MATGSPNPHDPQREIDELRRGLETRTVVGQALGMLMERFDIDSEHAFQLLRRVSNTTNTKVHDIAADIVAKRHVPGIPGPSRR